ncbi:MAG: riboflavin biosynthesis protein RibF [Fimbriimonadales bacterium]|nr:riboflavin biosynthesis protein RibF [Fimbriimonadales bacterium]
MLSFLGTAGLVPSWSGSVVCIGTFDGVHLGHRAVIAEAVAEAESLGKPSVLVTFDRHPAAVLAPDRCPPSLGSLGSNLRRFEELGIAVSLVLPFDEALASQTAEQFWEGVLKGLLRAERLVVGHDFAFGRGRRGTASWLSERVPTTVVPPFETGGARVSSSRIRECVLAGRMEEAAILLGRPYALEGVVVQGERLGRELGYPTANLGLVCNQAVPTDGVYAGLCRTVRGTYAAAVSIGTRSTVGGSRRAIEAYLLDYPGDALYGTAVFLEVARWLRPQETFPDREALKRQMALDVEAVRRGFAR